MELFARLFARISQLEGSVVDLQRRLNNVMREARVIEVDASTGTAVVEAQGGKTKKVPWLQRAGTIRDWDPPTPGERVVLLSPNGDPGRGMILSGGYSAEFGQPHDQPGEAFRTVGEGSDLFAGDRRVIEHQLIILRGTIRLEGPVDVVGPKLHHNGVNVGDDHRHRDVEPGPGLSGTPL